MGKATVLKKLTSDKDLGKCADVFMYNSSTRDQIIEAGDLAMQILTGNSLFFTLITPALIVIV